MPEQIFEINEPDIVHEVIDGEAIMVDMNTGAYYSLDAVGGLAWEVLQQGAASAGELAAALLPAVSGETGALEADLAGLLEELRAEGLVRPAAATAARKALTREPQPYKRPDLKKYTDLEALLRIDPIHDTAPEGWPQARSDATE